MAPGGGARAAPHARAALLLLLAAVLLALASAAQEAPGAYRWDDRAGQHDRVQTLIDWANGLADRARSDADDVAAADRAVLMEEKVSSATASRAMLAHWRARRSRHAAKRLQEAAGQQEERGQVVRLQMQLARKRAEMGSLDDVESEMARAGGQGVFKSAKTVASAVASLAEMASKVQTDLDRKQRRAKRAGGEMALLEVGGSLRGKQKRNRRILPLLAAVDKGTTALGQGLEAFAGALSGAGGPGTVRGCIMCIYYLEQLERDVGNGRSVSYSDSYPHYANPTDYPGPAAYFKGEGGRTAPVDNMAEPVPGPGFVYGSFLEQDERAGGVRGVVRAFADELRRASLLQTGQRSPVDPWQDGGDYSSFMSEKQNLAARLRQESTLEPREEVTAQRDRASGTAPLSWYYSMAEQNGGKTPDAPPPEPAQGGDAAAAAAARAAAEKKRQVNTNSVEYQREVADEWLREHEGGDVDGGDGGAAAAAAAGAAAAAQPAAESRVVVEAPEVGQVSTRAAPQSVPAVAAAEPRAVVRVPRVPRVAPTSAAVSPLRAAEAAARAAESTAARAAATHAADRSSARTEAALTTPARRVAVRSTAESAEEKAAEMQQQLKQMMDGVEKELTGLGHHVSGAPPSAVSLLETGATRFGSSPAEVETVGVDEADVQSVLGSPDADPSDEQSLVGGGRPVQGRRAGAGASAEARRAGADAVPAREARRMRFATARAHGRARMLARGRAGAGAGAKFINALKSGTGFGVCRDGVVGCRPRLMAYGRRAMEQRALREQTRAQFMRLRNDIVMSLKDTCSSVPKSFSASCLGFLSQVDVVADKYLHDYDDEEICVDIGMCNADMLDLPSKPKAMPM